MNFVAATVTIREVNYFYKLHLGVKIKDVILSPLD